MMMQRAIKSSCRMMYLPKGHIALLSRNFSIDKEHIKRMRSLGSKDYNFQPVDNPKAPYALKNKQFFALYSKDALDYELNEKTAANHFGRQQNHIWSKEEINDLLENPTHYKPRNMTDIVMNSLMTGMYHAFNFITGYTAVNPSVKSIEWRLIILESVAGVPGFVAAGFRHFYSLRTLQRDHGWIHTLLEEAENERMHLLICLKMFEASLITRSLVLAAQMTLTPFLMTIYAIHPPALHRFVGYLEETACKTYTSIIEHVETPGTHLNTAWKDTPAPAIATAYYRMPEDASFCDTLKCMFADETHHRDVNHTLASLKWDDPSPFALKHKQDALRAYEMEMSGKTAWPSKLVEDVRQDLKQTEVIKKIQPVEVTA